MAIPDYIQFNELGTEPFSYIGLYNETLNAVVYSSIHKVDTPIVHVTLIAQPTTTIIHYQYGPLIVPVVVFPPVLNNAQLHKVYSGLLGNASNSNIQNSIHRQGNSDGVNAPVKWACGRYLNTPYLSRYLETPCYQY